MAKFDSTLLGKAVCSVGNVTMCYMNRQNIAKAKVFVRKDKPTPEMLAQRAKMKVLVQLSRRLLPVIRKGFAGIGRGSTSNAFVARNMKAVQVDEKYVATLDYKLLSVAGGVMYTPRVTATYSTEGKQYTFMQEIQEEADCFAFATDDVYAVLYETKLGRSRFVLLKKRGESGSTTYTLPEEWDASEVEAYSFATLKNGRAASDSVHLTIGE